MVTITVSNGKDEVYRNYSENADFTGVVESMLETLNNLK